MLITPSCRLFWLLLLSFWNLFCPKYQSVCFAVQPLFFMVFKLLSAYLYSTLYFGGVFCFAALLYYFVVCYSIFISRQTGKDIDAIIFLPRRHLVRAKTTSKISWKPWYITQTTSSGTICVWCGARWGLLRKYTQIHELQSFGFPNPWISVILMAFRCKTWKFGVQKAWQMSP